MLACLTTRPDPWAETSQITNAKTKSTHRPTSCVIKGLRIIPVADWTAFEEILKAVPSAHAPTVPVDDETLTAARNLFAEGWTATRTDPSLWTGESDIQKAMDLSVVPAMTMLGVNGLFGGKAVQQTLAAQDDANVRVTPDLMAYARLQIAHNGAEPLKKAKFSGEVKTPNNCGIGPEPQDIRSTPSDEIAWQAASRDAADARDKRLGTVHQVETQMVAADIRVSLLLDGIHLVLFVLAVPVALEPVLYMFAMPQHCPEEPRSPFTAIHAALSAAASSAPCAPNCSVAARGAVMLRCRSRCRIVPLCHLWWHRCSSAAATCCQVARKPSSMSFMEPHMTLCNMFSCGPMFGGFSPTPARGLPKLQVLSWQKL